MGENELTNEEKQNEFIEKSINPAQEFGENVIITELRQTKSIISSGKFKKIKSLRLENQDIDEEVRIFLSGLGGLDSLYFYKCKVDFLTLSNNVLYSDILGIVDCGLASRSDPLVLGPMIKWESVELWICLTIRLGLNLIHFLIILIITFWDVCQLTKLY